VGSKVLTAKVAKKGGVAKKRALETGRAGLRPGLDSRGGCRYGGF
jgi:hypothetical protein